MMNFPYPLEYGYLMALKRSALGFRHSTGLVWDARFTPNHDAAVDPLATYGVTPEQADELHRLNRVIGTVTQVAVEAAQAALLKEMPLADPSSVALVLGSEDCFAQWRTAVGVAIAFQVTVVPNSIAPTVAVPVNRPS